MLGQTDPCKQATVADSSTQPVQDVGHGAKLVPSSFVQVGTEGVELGTGNVLFPPSELVHNSHHIDQIGRLGADGAPLPLVQVLGDSEHNVTANHVSLHVGQVELDSGEHGAVVVPLPMLTNTSEVQVLDPQTASFEPSKTTQHFLLRGDLEADHEQVLQVQAGGVSRQVLLASESCWNNTEVTGSRKGRCKTFAFTPSILPFANVDDIADLVGQAPKDIHKVGNLLDLKVQLPAGYFTDKVLPAPSCVLKSNEVYTPDYFVALHNITNASGVRADESAYPASRPNNLGARIRLPHAKLRLNRLGHHL